MDTTPNGSEGPKDPYEEKVKLLEKRIEDLEKELKNKPSTKDQKDSEAVGPQIGNAEADINMGGLVEGVIGQFVPGLGGIIKALEKASPEFRQRIADTDSEIKHRIDVGWSSKPVVDYSISTRPMGRGRRKPARTAPAAKVTLPDIGPAKEPVIDVLDGKDYITVIADLPGISDEGLEIKLLENALEITSGEFSKKIDLPCHPKSILERSYKNGILQLKIDREDNGHQNR